MKIYEIITEAPELKDKQAHAKNKNFIWDATQRTWLDKNTGVPASGLYLKQLNQAYGLDIKGQPTRPSLVQRTKDYVAGKTPGLAQATRLNKDAGIIRKGAAVAGAGIGKAIGKALGGAVGAVSGTGEFAKAALQSRQTQPQQPQDQRPQAQPANAPTDYSQYDRPAYQRVQKKATSTPTKIQKPRVRVKPQ